MRTVMLLALPLILVSCGKEEPKAPTSPPAVADRAQDPVCKMPVDKKTSIKITHEGADYYFCAEECVKKFKAEPAKYAAHCSCANMKRACSCDHCGGKEPCDCVK